MSRSLAGVCAGRGKRGLQGETSNQATGTVVTFRTDPPTGRLEPAGRIAVPSPVCLRFLRV
ncbi:MAG: hypothetical protein ACUVX9_18020 [Anaerolineae bacterium]